MNIAVLFDGAGLARLGLERAGHTCTGYEIDPAKHYLSQMVGSGNSVLADVRDVDLSGFDAVWASPPCQGRSKANTQATSETRLSTYSDYADLLAYSLSIPARFPNIKTLWVENVPGLSPKDNCWGSLYNAAQFLEAPIQNRQRIIGGCFERPHTWRVFKPHYLEDGWNICPTITASEYKGCASDKRRASGFYGRRLALRECAYHQGFAIPNGLLKSWFHLPALENPKTGEPYTEAQWRNVLYEAIGNGVPTYMSQAFGAAYCGNVQGWINAPLFEEAA
jgi:site-specific DNA-cytosine methylase